MGESRDKLRSQIFWEGDAQLPHWYSYANRAPHLYGHIILANDQEDTDINKAPEGFERALNLNIDVLLKWAKKHKEGKCLPVFFRMNVSKEQFRVHILPVSRQEIEEAAGSLVARIPRLAGRKGGFLHYLGSREHLADQRDADFRQRAGNEEAIKELMNIGGIPTLVNQLRALISIRKSSI